MQTLIYVMVWAQRRTDGRVLGPVDDIVVLGTGNWASLCIRFLRRAWCNRLSCREFPSDMVRGDSDRQIQLISFGFRVWWGCSLLLSRCQWITVKSILWSSGDNNLGKHPGRRRRSLVVPSTGRTFVRVPQHPPGRPHVTLRTLTSLSPVKTRCRMLHPPLVLRQDLCSYDMHACINASVKQLLESF